MLGHRSPYLDVPARAILALVHFRTLVTLRKVRVRVRVGLELRFGLVRVRIRVRVRLVRFRVRVMLG